MRNRLVLFAGIVLLASLTLAGTCRKAPPSAQAPAAPPTTVTAEPATPPAQETRKEVTEPFPAKPVESAAITEPSAADLNRQKVLRTVYFAYDKADLSEETVAALRANADWLRANSKRKVVIEGNCDERGTVEYNLALGQRRAAAAREYLVSLGIDAARLRTVSYGKERPADPGHGEESWGKNRRDDFVIEP